MKAGKTKALLVALACAGMPLVTSGGCDPRTGMFDFYRDDDGYYYYDDTYYYDDYYYDDYYYYDDCTRCDDDGWGSWFDWF